MFVCWKLFVFSVATKETQTFRDACLQLWSFCLGACEALFSRQRHSNQNVNNSLHSKRALARTEASEAHESSDSTSCYKNLYPLAGCFFVPAQALSVFYALFCLAIVPQHFIVLQLYSALFFYNFFSKLIILFFLCFFICSLNKNHSSIRCIKTTLFNQVKDSIRCRLPIPPQHVCPTHSLPPRNSIHHTPSLPTTQFQAAHPPSTHFHPPLLLIHH